MKKFLLFLGIIFLAYITAFYTAGKKNGFEDPFDFSYFEQKINNYLDFEYENDKKEINNDYFQNGIFFLEDENYDEALEQFFEALYENNNYENNYYIGYIYLMQEDYMNAVSYLNTSIDLNSVNAKAFRDRGIAKFHQTYYDEAIKDLYFSTELYPDDPLTYYNIALCYEAQSKYEVALQSAETALLYDSVNIDYLFKAAYLAYSAEKIELSSKYYKSLLKIDNTDKYSLINLGLCYSKMEENDSAIYYYDIVLAKYPDYALAYNNKGYIYQKAGDYNEALKLYNKSIELDPYKTDSYWNRGDCYYAIKKYPDAIKDFQKVYELNPDLFNALYQIGESYEKLNLIPNALDYYEQYQSLASSNSIYFDKVSDKIRNLN